MRNIDTKMLEERYDEINEGIFDTMRASRAGLKAGGNAITGNIAAGAKGIRGVTSAFLRGDKQGVKQAASTALGNIKNVKDARSGAKVDSILQSFKGKADNFSREIQTDLQRIGLDKDQSEDIQETLDIIKFSANLLSTVIEKKPKNYDDLRELIPANTSSNPPPIPKKSVVHPKGTFNNNR